MTQGRRRGRASWRPGQSPWTALGGITALIVGSVLPIGSVHWSVICTVCGAGCLGFVLGARELGRSWNPVASTCALLALWSLLTLLPLPVGLVQVISPHTGTAWLEALSPVDRQAPTWVCLSLDPVATTLEVSKWSLYAVVAVFAAHVAQTRGLGVVLIVIWASAVLVALITVFQALAGLSTILGVYTPLGGGSRVIPTVLVNPNNLAGYCNLGAFCGVGLLVSKRRPLPATVVTAGVIICTATTFFSASRGGVVALLAGAIALGVRWTWRRMFGRRRDGGENRLASWLPSVAAVLFTVSVIGLGGTNAMWREILSDDLSKLNEPYTLLPALRDYFFTGVGRGAFETVSYQYFRDSPFTVHRSVENFVMSWAVEWGTPVAILALLRFASLLRPARIRLGPHRSAFSAYVGLLVLFAQNVLDLGLEVLSVTVAAFALFGALEGSRMHRLPSRARSKANGVSNTSILTSRYFPRFVAVLGLVTAIAAGTLGPSIFELRPALASEVDGLVKSGETMNTVANRLVSEMKRRPAEHYLPLLGAQAAIALNEDALPWAAAALNRAPFNGKAHFMVAEALVQRGALKQAMLNYRYAASRDRRLIESAGRRVATLTSDPSLILMATPERNAGMFLLAANGELRSQEHATLRRTLLAAAQERDPGSRSVQTAYGFALIGDLRRESTPCGNADRCPIENPKTIVRQVREIASKLRKDPQCAGLRMEAQLDVLTGDLAGANRRLTQCNQCQSPLPCLKDRLNVADRLEDSHLRKEVESAYVGQACSNSPACAEAKKFIAEQAERRGDWLSAYAHYIQAASREPSRDNWVRVTRSALSAGQIERASAAYDSVKRLGGRDPQLEALLVKARRERLRRSLSSGDLPR